MGGADNELHIQKVASCVNRKLAELEDTEAYRSLPNDLKPVLVELNIADELIQAQDTIEMLRNDLRLRETELSEIKQALVETQMKLESPEASHTQGKKGSYHR